MEVLCSLSVSLAGVIFRGITSCEAAINQLQPFPNLHSSQPIGVSHMDVQWADTASLRIDFVG
jgi:hypothetical protein